MTGWYDSSEPTIEERLEAIEMRIQALERRLPKAEEPYGVPVVLYGPCRIHKNIPCSCTVR